MNLCYLVLMLHAELNMAALEETFEEQDMLARDDRDTGDSKNEPHINRVVPVHEDHQTLAVKDSILGPGRMGSLACFAEGQEPEPEDVPVKLKAIK